MSRELESWNQTNRTVNNQTCGSFAWQKFLSTACCYDMKQWLEDTSPSEHCHSHPTRSKGTHGYSSALKMLSGECFSCPQSSSTFRTFSYSQQSETKIIRGGRYEDVCTCMPSESDSPPVSWGEWIGGAPVSNVHFVSQAMHLIPPFFHWLVFIIIID